MENDTGCVLSELRARSPEPLSTRIYELQRSRHVQEKTPMRVCVQADLRIDNDPLSGTDPIELQHFKSNEYIAVSCPWYIPGHDTVSGRYRFAPEQPSGVIMPPDDILNRILNFKLCNPDYVNTPFWIDKICINQEASDQKEIAVHSMDLVYQYSGRKVVTDGNVRFVGCSLGLAFVEIKTVDRLTMLRNLLDGEFADTIETKPTLRVSVEEAVAVLDLIELILSDNWWHRAWIFQEEFLASKHMVLLLPCTLDRTGLYETNEDGVDLFGRTRGEIEVRPLNFRTEVTIFCLALYQQVDKTSQDRCNQILKNARRYSFLYRSGYTPGAGSIVKAMSPAIFEDISVRGITVPSDMLAIAANCCRYTTRLNSQDLNLVKASLSIAILTLFVVNGEILRHDIPRDAVLNQTIFQVLSRVKLVIQPPVPAGELIFIKMCRLPAINMKPEGLMVKGVLSRLDKKMKVKVLESDRDLYWKTNDTTLTSTLTDAEIRLLKALIADLKRMKEGGDALHTKLKEFLYEKAAEKKAGRSAQYWSLLHISVMMAKAICRAIAEGRVLWLSRRHVPGRWTPWLGIFIPDDPFDVSGVISYAFTARETDNELRDRGATLARRNAWVTSLEVGFDPATKQIMPKRWMNGINFFNNRDHPDNFLMPWPKWMH
ncbi:hypothetical protein F5B22DRAFT_470460 [Xylaria bambusicola]|uniref:uncharacterized protein n=1 Tax=Xylaria bambusicola TaxID=326684 RepID=UPI002007EFE8|nr:uncharacterized protein F5B22DRAFT_470460 [Xylaria bambusicola]KAI0522307.1 hypothetical protein F5B22DRAFT_470460 [Xylaria bambusicola]